MRLPAQEIVAKLLWAATTASNDDLSEPGSEKRKRHVERLDILREAAEWIAIELATDDKNRLEK